MILIPIKKQIGQSQRRWQRLERVGLIFLLLGIVGIAVIHTPSLMARYAAQYELPVVNTPFQFGQEQGVSQQEYETALVDAPLVLRVPDHKIEANVVPDIPTNDEGAYWKALTRGVALARNSAALDANTGNSFIFGHSGRITLDPSPYDTIFAALPNVETGQTIEIITHGETDTYVVSSSRSVAADDFSVLEDIPGKKTVTLMTCWPVNTWYKRWVVVAERVGHKPLTSDN